MLSIVKIDLCLPLFTRSFCIHLRLFDLFLQRLRFIPVHRKSEIIIRRFENLTTCTSWQKLVDRLINQHASGSEWTQCYRSSESEDILIPLHHLAVHRRTVHSTDEHSATEVAKAKISSYHFTTWQFTEERFTPQVNATGESFGASCPWKAS